MNAEKIRSEIDKLDLSEKLLLVEDIWDSIATGNAELPMREWQQKELDKRYREYKEGKAALHEWSQVHEELRKKYQ